VRRNESIKVSITLGTPINSIYSNPRVNLLTHGDAAYIALWLSTSQQHSLALTWMSSTQQRISMRLKLPFLKTPGSMRIPAGVGCFPCLSLMPVKSVGGLIIFPPKLSSRLWPVTNFIHGLCVVKPAIYHGI
jgi:hypothetical protein